MENCKSHSWVNILGLILSDFRSFFYTISNMESVVPTIIGKTLAIQAIDAGVDADAAATTIRVIILTL